MKFRKIFSVEFGYQVRSTSTWIYFFVLLCSAIFFTALVSPNDGVYSNAPYFIAGIIIFGGMIWLLIAAPLAGEAAARDVYSRMHPLIYTSPISKLDYLGGRFLAALLVNALLIFAAPLGVLISFHVLGINEAGLGPFRASAYLSVYFLVSLPNAFVATALQFSFSALTRNVATSYLIGLLLALFAHLVGMSLATLFGNWDFVRLLDPVGLAGLINTEFATWTPAEKNTRLITLEGMFLWNRILWPTVGVGALLLAYTRFNFAHTVTANWWSRLRKNHFEETVEVGDRPTNRMAITVPLVERTFQSSTALFQTWMIARASFQRIATHPAGLTLVGIVAIVSAVFGDRIISQFGIPLVPTTQQVLTYLATPVANLATPWVVVPLLIMYFAGELIWQEREAKSNDIADALPVGDWALFTGKYLGLALVVFAWMTLIMACGILMQLSVGYFTIDIDLYLITLFGLQLTEYLLFAVLAITVHAIANQKYIAHMLMVLIFIFLAFPAKFNVEHPMLIFGADPGWWNTEMTGFGRTLFPWLTVKLYWIAWALLLAVVARVLWARGREEDFSYRVRYAGKQFTPATIKVLIVAIVGMISLGSFIFYNTNVLNEYATSREIGERKALYEIRYGKYRNRLQPQLTGTRLNVELYPDQHRIEIRAAYTLVNVDSVAIDTVHLGSVSGNKPYEIIFSRAAACVVTDDELTHYIYRLLKPLLPGDSLTLNFVVHHQQRGFGHVTAMPLSSESSTYFTNYDLLPNIGYLWHREIRDPDSRKKYGLPARPAIASLYDKEARKRSASTDHNSFEAIIGTSPDQVAVAPGTLKRTWKENNRMYFHFKTDVPIRGEYAIVSGHYAMKESGWKDVAIRIYHHPQHEMNIDRMMGSVRASLEYYSEQFGPYPFGHITLVEHPGNDGGMHAEASMIDFGEQFTLITPDVSPNGFDLPYYIVAHEVAHQWFGSAQLTPANVEGAGVLIEGLAVYCGMQVLKAQYGDAHVQRYVDFVHTSYELPRVLATPSLLQANETFLYYRKGGLAMHALSQYIGTKNVNVALRTLLDKHKSKMLPLPTTLDLYHELKNQTPDSLHYLLQDLFEKNTYWQLKTQQLTAAQTNNEKWDVTLKIQARKVVTDSLGADHEVPMNDWLEVGIYEDGKGAHEPLYLQKHRIRSGEQVINLTVPRKPHHGGIDPRHLMIDLKTHDNMIESGEGGK
ncbi:MAG TPA: M1 family aminopeptidase [Chryseosolibacter sp.]